MVLAQAFDQRPDFDDLVRVQPTVGSSRMSTGGLPIAPGQPYTLTVALFERFLITRPYTSSILTMRQISAMCFCRGRAHFFRSYMKSRYSRTVMSR